MALIIKSINLFKRVLAPNTNSILLNKFSQQVHNPVSSVFSPVIGKQNCKQKDDRTYMNQKANGNENGQTSELSCDHVKAGNNCRDICQKHYNLIDNELHKQK